MARISPSQARKRRDRPPASSETVRRRMQSTPRRDTPEELALRRAVHRLGLRFRTDHMLPGLRRRADLLFAGSQVAVFVDGCFWHGCAEHGTWPKTNAAWWRAKIESNRRRDADTTQQLTQRGWAVVRVWTHDDPIQAARRIAKLVSRRTSRRSNA